MEHIHPFEIKEKCGVVGVWTKDNSALYLARRALAALQHRGQESAGLSVLNQDGKIVTHKGMGLVPHVLTESVLKKLGTGHTSIGQNRYATFGKSSTENAQPITLKHGTFQLSLGHNGNIPDVANLKKHLGLEKSALGDTELMTSLILKERKHHESWEETLEAVLPQCHGAYCLVIITSDGSLFGARDPYGIRPLCLGKLDDGWIIASESAALDTIGATFVREVKPGEIIKITKKGKLTSTFFGEPKRPRFCLFECIYFARPDSFINGIRIRTGREASGKILGERMKQKGIKPDVVVPTFDSGYPAAKGVAKALDIPIVDAITTSHYVGRTFIQPGQTNRISAVNGKHNIVPDEVVGKKIVIVDDSAVRLTTSTALARKFKEAGATKIYMAFASPPVVNQCNLGIDMRSKKELPAAKFEKESFETIEKKVAEHVGADAVTYLPIKETAHAMQGKQENFYTFPFGGPHPINDKQEVFPKRKHKITGKPKLCIFISGGGTNLQVMIDAIQHGELDAQIVSVVSNKPDAYGLTRAKKHKIPTTVIAYEGKRSDAAARKAYEEKLIEHIDSVKPDLIQLAGWQLVLDATFLTAMQDRQIPVINQHPALLTPDNKETIATSRGIIPVIRGTHAIQDAFTQKLPVSGFTAHQVLPSDTFDTGPIILQAEVRRQADDTIETWEQRLRETEYLFIVTAIKRALHVMQHGIDISKGDFPW